MDRGLNSLLEKSSSALEPASVEEATLVVLSFAAHRPTQAQSFPRKRESTPQANGNAPLTDWIPAFAGMTGQPTGFEGDSLPNDATTRHLGLLDGVRTSAVT